ncbi:MAG: alpha/beta hydrolase [Opitutales bacterium]|nr:alpha/beta hydrolase [Opitutales bacterium]
MKKSSFFVFAAAFFAAVLSLKAADGVEALPLESGWDKTFPRSEKVEHVKVAFRNRYGIVLAADLYKPKAVFGKLSALAVSGPFGAVKEQCSGLYAQTLAERGFLTLAFDPSFTGESGGEPRYMASPDINTEDFQAAVDYLSCREDVDADKIGIVGICGWGGLAINAAALDTRVKATVAVTMYDMHRVNVRGYFDQQGEDARYAAKVAQNAERTKAFKTGVYERAGGVVDPLPADAPDFVKDYFDYYKTPRGYHSRSLNSNEGWAKIGCLSFFNQPILAYSSEIRSPVLIVHGDKAHSFYFGRDAFENMTKDSRWAANKRLLVVPGAVHTDLYDGGPKNVIPWDEIEAFLKTELKK